MPDRDLKCLKSKRAQILDNLVSYVCRVSTILWGQANKITVFLLSTARFSAVTAERIATSSPSTGSTFAGKNMADGVEVGPWAKTDGSGSAQLCGSTSDGEIRW